MAAGNKFATMLSRNTSRMTVVLVYVALEWVLIVLLLLNSLFSYLIRKFVAYFGLKPPCPWCSRIDHLLEPCREFEGHPFIESVCEAHAKEISRLGYCLKHRRLVEACRTCEDCSLARGCHQGSVIASVSLVAQTDVGDEGEVAKCSCCGAGLNDGFYSKYFLKKGLFKPSWDVLSDGDKVASVIREEEEEIEEEEKKRKGADEDGEGDKDDDAGQDVVVEEEKEEERRKMVVVMEEEDADIVEKVVDEPLGKASIGSIVDSDGGDSSCNITALNLIDSCDSDRRRLAPVEIIDSVTQPYVLGAKETSVGRSDNARLNLLDSFDDHLQRESLENESVAYYHGCSPAVELQGSLAEDGSLTCFDQNNRRETVDERDESDGMAIAGQAEDSDKVLPIHDQITATASKGTIPVEEKSTISQDGIVHEEPVVRCSECTEGASSTSSYDDTQKSLTSSALNVEEEQGQGGVRESADEEIDGCFALETSCVTGKMEQRIKQLSLGSEVNEIDEEREPETPNHMDVFQSLHKRLMMERKESGIESVDISVLSEPEGSEMVVIEQLEAALKAERVAFSALYAELEEERSASAIAANQTMAMITRLQEEKAAMQMEALQYQRMMEEQSEYDQEALQLLNELMVKREKEKQELEKELELYRKKVLHYEARERRMRKTKANENGVGQILNHQVQRVSSASSTGGDSDELSADFNDEDDGSDTIFESNQNTPGEAVHNSSNEHENTKLTTLDESLADFEHERLSILEQLKALEEKLLTLSDEESESTMTMNQVVGMPGAVVPEESFELFVGNSNLEGSHCVDTDGKDELFGEDADLVVNGTPDHLTSNCKRPAHRTYDGPMPKQLLPLFVAASCENGNEEEVEDEEEEEASYNHSDVHLCKHVAIEEEVEQVYERLQALEADEEFLKHCVNSLKKGDKGMQLLQEILQHLRDLRAVEHRSRNLGDATPL
ncbi:myosin-binding protein 3-like [Nymphaea colorata]|nr:myosin-binding protein 3-like [Nymphaea colorata]